MAQEEKQKSVVEMQAEKIHCEHCNRFYPAKDFYKDKNGDPMKKCKKCMASLIDLKSPSTVMKIMEEIDIPYIPDEWNSLRERYEFSTSKDGKTIRNKNANQSVLGRYIGKMRLEQYKGYKFSDTPQFMEQHDQEIQQKRDILHQKLEDLLDKGYDPDTAMQLMAGRIDAEDEDPALTKTQIKELKIKWGTLYNEEELIQLETFYGEMHESYDITSASHEDYLKQICKVSLRMHSLIDSGMYDEYQKLSNTYDKMMKSAKFTASQEKEEDKFIDSISEMVRLCEEEGFIPVYHTDEPQDIVDVTLRDFTNYVRNLVEKELNLDSLIEKGLEQIKLDEEKEQMSADDALFVEEDMVSDDDLLFEAVNTEVLPELTDEAKLLGVELDGEE